MVRLILYVNMEILSLYFDRDEAALTQTAQRYGPYCHHIAYGILHSRRDTEECVNDTWLGAWNAIPPARPDPLRTFVCAIARNLATKRYHANTAAKRNSHYDFALDELSECIPALNTVEEEYAARELAQLINRFLDSLAYEDKFIFMRRYWYADPLADIARMAGMSYGAASVRLHRTKTKLRNFLLKEGVHV